MRKRRTCCNAKVFPCCPDVEDPETGSGWARACVVPAAAEARFPGVRVPGEVGAAGGSTVSPGGCEERRGRRRGWRERDGRRVKRGQVEVVVGQLVGWQRQGARQARNWFERWSWWSTFGAFGPQGRRLARQRASPFDDESAAAQDELVERLVGGQLGTDAVGELDERALLPRQHGDAADLAVLVEVVAQVLLRQTVAQVADVERCDGGVLRRLQFGHGGCPAQQFVGHRVVDAVVAVADVLVGQRIVRVRGLLVPVRALLASLTLAFHPEAADVRPVAFVVGCGTCQLHQEVAGALRLGEGPVRLAGVAVGHGALHVLRVVFLVDVRLGHVVTQAERVVAHLHRQAVVQVQQAGLAHVLELAARLTDFGLLEAHPAAGTPSEDGERARAYLALLAETLFGHAYVRVVAQACLAEDGEFGFFPVEPIVGIRTF
ncbi:hypothetical protein MTO96_026891 [Rhipicephalus appendiculatus]